MELSNRLVKKLIIVTLAAAMILGAAFGIAWIKGLTLPSWIIWGDKTIEIDGGESGDFLVQLSDKSICALNDAGETIWQLENGIKVQDAIMADIDNDDADELLVLCWKIGRYGGRRPFWVMHDEKQWSQHIYIYEVTADGIGAKWMASDIHTLVKKWDIYEKCFIRCYTPDDEESFWMWNSWGLERIPKETIDEWTAIRKNRLSQKTILDEDFEMAGNPDEDKTFEAGDNLPPGDNQEALEAVDDLGECVEIVMVGDILLHDGVSASCRLEGGEYDFSPLFKNTNKVISRADIAIVNQEVIIGGEELRITGYPSFNAPYEVGDALADAGFDIVCHATNHALDRGFKGVNNCLSYWRDNHPEIAVLGICDDADDYDSVYICESKGIKIAVLNYTYGTNGIPLPEGKPYLVSLLDKAKIASDLEYAEKNADFTVVCPHWGIEYQLEVCSEQESMAKFMVENGADLIIGTHPHVIEPIKWVEAENGNRALCYYSLGNYINWTAGRGNNVSNRMVGGMAHVSLECDANDKNDAELIYDYGVYPLVSHVEHTPGKVTTYFLQDYTNELAADNAINEQVSDFTIEYCNSLCGDVWGELVQNVEIR